MNAAVYPHTEETDILRCIICLAALFHEDVSFRLDGLKYGMRRKRYVCSNGHSNIATCGFVDENVDAARARAEHRPQLNRGQQRKYTFEEQPPQDCDVCSKPLPLRRVADMKRHIECRLEYMRTYRERLAQKRKGK